MKNRINKNRLLLKHQLSRAAGWCEPSSLIELTTTRTEAIQIRRTCASSLETLTRPSLHHASPHARGEKRDSRCALNVTVNMNLITQSPCSHFHLIKIWKAIFTETLIHWKLSDTTLYSMTVGVHRHVESHQLTLFDEHLYSFTVICFQQFDEKSVGLTY